jgi:hypothetical protein
VRKSQDKPLIVEWPSAERVEPESEMQDGLVVVRYDGCTACCSAPGSGSTGGGAGTTSARS